MTTYDEQPDIMAIGDSMYQGIRSMSFLPAMVNHSAPKQVADAIGMSMTVPDLQQPLLFEGVVTDAPLCSECGSIMTRNGSCYKCGNCGGTSGCS